MSSSIEPSIYDNQISLLYRVGEYLDTPTKYIIVRDALPGETTTNNKVVIDGTTYVPIIDLVMEKVDSPLETISIPGISDLDLIFFYFWASENQGIPPIQTYNQIQAFLLSKGENPFQSLNDLVVRYQAWAKDYQVTKQSDQEVLSEIIGIQETFEQIQNVPTASPVVVDRITLQSTPVIDGVKPKIEDGLDIFNQLIPSLYVPFIEYHDGTRAYYKIFRGTSIVTDLRFPGQEPNLEMILLPETTLEPNTFEATLWVGDQDQVITRPTRDGYTKLTYNLETGLLNFKTKIGQETSKEEILARVKSAFPSLDLGQVIEARISGEFDLYLNQTLETYVFLHLILNDPTFIGYVYLDERQKPDPEKKRTTIHYRSILGQSDKAVPTSVSAVISQQVSTIEQPNLPIGTPYLRINITKAVSRLAAEQFQEILRLLIGRYLETKDEIIKIYTYYLPNVPKPRIVKKGTKAPPPTRVTNIKLLKKAAPHIFVSNYARDCQPPYQPKVITEDEREEWVNKLVQNPDTGEWEKRQILSYPPGIPEILLVCPNDERPYPGVRENNRKNKDQYPYVPCCYERDKMSPGVKSNYNLYYHGDPIENKRANKRTNLITDKFLSPKGYGEIPVTLERILAKFSSTPSFKRYGIIRDTNSLVHAIMDATNYKNYSLMKDEGKIKLVNSLRLEIPTLVDLNVTKQELYDLTLEEIEAQITSSDYFFDPFLYYRALEEIFNLNIYVFIPTKKDPKIEIPRHKIFHSRPSRSRDTVIIYKHWGSESDGLEYPQCELIVSIDQKVITKVFNREMSQALHQLFLITSSTLTWSPDQTPQKNLYSNGPSFQSVLNGTSQIIDNYGKLRGLSRDGMTIFVPPSQPENLPLLQELGLVEAQVAIDQFGPPTGVSRNLTQDSIVGFWFSEFFVPIIPTSSSEYDSISSGPDPPISLDNYPEQVGDRIIKLKRYLSLIVQVIRWLYLISKLDPTTFILSYGKIYPDPVEDSTTFYDLSTLPRKLPPITTVEDGIEHLKSIAPTLIEDNKIYFYSVVFAEKILDYLIKLPKIEAVPEYLDSYYQYESDFIALPGTVTIIGQNTLNIWLRQLSEAKGVKILSSLEDDNLKDRVEPYMYLDPKYGLFLIQNVYKKEQSLNTSRYLGQVWAIEQVNLGYGIEIEETIEPYSIYEISPGFALQNMGHQEERLKVLKYSNGDYAALLPIQS